jgi:peptidoglycan/LPS O-acetylase OafA/YrhL
MQKVDVPEVARENKPRFESVDALRGIACLSVLWFHIWYCLSPAPSWPSLAIGSHHLSLWRPVTRGYGGVDIFFVLSGFCLSFPIFSRPNRAVRWDKYFIARVRRIVPPYWAALFLFAAMSLLARHYRVQNYFGNELEWPGKWGVVLGAVFWKRVLSWPFWTLVLEWRWYFLFPLCVWLCRKTSGWVMLLISIPLSAVSMWLKFGLQMPWAVDWTGGVFRYLPLFAFGMIAAELAATGGRNAAEKLIVRNARWGMLVWLAALLILPADAQQMMSWSGTIQRISMFGVFAFFATIAAVRDARVGSILAWKPLVWVGSFSYSLYLLHAPFVLAGEHLCQKYTTSRSILLICYTVVIPLTVILGAYLFFLLFERPFLTRKPERPAAPATSLAALPEAAAP